MFLVRKGGVYDRRSAPCSTVLQRPEIRAISVDLATRSAAECRTVINSWWANGGQASSPTVSLELRNILPNSSRLTAFIRIVVTDRLPRT